MPTKIPHDEEQRRLQQLQLEIQYHESLENIKQRPLSSTKDAFLPTSEPKKRGPKKKPLTPSRVARFKVRRIKANGRERDRMKDLNQELERLRETIPCFSQSQKLSKIETLRLAKNYIEALTQMISNDQIPDNQHFAQLLCKDLSPNTMNLVAATLSLNPRIIQQNDVDQHRPMVSNETYFLSSMYPRANNPLEFINMKTSNVTSESEDDTAIYSSTSLDHGSSHYGDSSIDDLTLPDHFQTFPNEQSFMSTDYYYY